MDLAEHASSSPTLADFSSAFRAELAEKAEFSYTALPDWLGVMVVGAEGPFTDRALAFARSNASWTTAVGILRRRLRPSIIGYRTDWRGQRLIQYTIYLRPPLPVAWITARDALQAALGRGWIGPDLELVSAALGLTGPSIIGVRGATGSEPCASAYFPIADSPMAAVGRLASALGIPAAALDELTTAFATVHRVPSIVGIDSAEDARQVIKVDIPDVAVSDAAAFLDSAGRGRDARRVVRAARSLRRTSATYVGIKLEPKGVGGWKVYMQAWPAISNERVPHATRILIGDHPAHVTLAR